MCGICGEIRFDEATPDPSVTARMLRVLEPRGPDDQGLFGRQAALLGHRRLRIIDTSERSQQPLVDPELGLAIVYNGAIYNHAEVRRDLEGRGYRFFSDGDTEVVLKAWHAFGPEALSRLRGMFAFVIHDRESGRVVAARDPLGIKPLYYDASPHRLRFASTLPALLAAGVSDSSLDPVALAHYFTFHAVVPPPHTIVRGVRKLPPGSWMEISPQGRQTVRRYWELSFSPEADGKADPTEWKERVADALERAVARRLVADVPVGVLLSGGLDSSLITALVAKAGQGDLRTFSIGFESVGGEAGDEFRYSDVVAKACGTEHTQIRIPSSEMLDNLPDCIHAMSEPMVSHDNIGFYLLSREVSKHVKVVQSGQGADEVFAGYHWYPHFLETEDALATYRARFFDRDLDEIHGLLDPHHHVEDVPERFIREAFTRADAPRPIDKALHTDTTVMLVDDPVKRVDNMTMAFGVEARVPFLDTDLVELAARCPAELKLADGGKGVLKAVARDLLPAEVIDRPKGYFPVPALKYIRGPVLEMVRDALGSRVARERGLFRPAAVEALLADPEAHLTPLGGSKLWQVALLETWLQSHDVT